MLFFLFQKLCLLRVKWLTIVLKPKTRRTEKTILYLENFPRENSGYQYRAAKWAELLQKEGYKVDIWTLCEDKVDFETRIKTKPFSTFLLFALRIRLQQVLASRRFETVIVRRELLWFNDYGNLFLDKLLLKLHPNAILDFDDDIAAAKNQPKKISSLYGKFLLENGNKFNESLKLYKRFFVASNYLKNKVLQENTVISTDAVCVIPTCVDYDQYPQKVYPEKIDQFTFGWIGGDHNYAELDAIIPILNDLSNKQSFKLLVIGGKKFKRKAHFDIEFRSWSLDTEIQNLMAVDVGLMPLKESERTKGKGGFKLLQYMGLGIVSVASAITINNEIIDHGKDSYLCVNDKDWRETLLFILSNKNVLKKIGEKAREKITANYTFQAQYDNYINHLSHV